MKTILLPFVSRLDVDGNRFARSKADRVLNEVPATVRNQFSTMPFRVCAFCVLMCFATMVAGSFNVMAAAAGEEGSSMNALLNNSIGAIPNSSIVILTVPGTSNPWLAGMPEGTTADEGDVAPNQSPVLVGGIKIVPGARLTFSANGGVAFGPGGPLSPPDGQSAFGRHRIGIEHGISDIQAPWNSLVGVFLDDSQPSSSPAPGPLDFGSVNSRNYSTLSPQLKQVFFIGDGRNSTGGAQTVTIPPGATRLFLGTMDGYGWNNNPGAFLVLVATLPVVSLPATVPGTSNPWLAGMPAGTTADEGDIAPNQSPVLVSGNGISPGDILTFNVTGGVAYGPGGPLSPPDGQSAFGRHRIGVEHGISDIQAPWNSLVGVFLSDSQPNTSPAPGSLDFGVVSNRNYATLSPQLKQVFFIGNGLDSAGGVQRVIVPPNTTRLFLGTMDGYGWNDNQGAFAVNIASFLLNMPPVADASKTTTLLISPNGIDASVKLDGSLSYDPDGDVLSYQWSRLSPPPVTLLATNVEANVNLPVGANLVALVVNDGLEQDTDTITITVLTTAQAVERLIGLVNSSNLQLKKPLLDTLDAALASIKRGNSHSAVGQLHAFQNKVWAQVYPDNPELAMTLINAAGEVIDALGGDGGLLNAGKVQSLNRQANSQAQLQIEGASDTTYLIEASTDLINWKSVGTTSVSTNGTFDFEDPDAANYPSRFYRVRQLP